MWDLLKALEGMCADGRAYEIDDSTYRVGEKKKYSTGIDPYTRNRNAVYATGNKWAIENWEATHN